MAAAGAVLHAPQASSAGAPALLLASNRRPPDAVLINRKIARHRVGRADPPVEHEESRRRTPTYRRPALEVSRFDVEGIKSGIGAADVRDEIEATVEIDQFANRPRFA